jgi:hypothetical protein
MSPRAKAAGALVFAAAVASGSPAAEAACHTAHVAGTISVRDQGHLGFTKSSGSQIFDEGKMLGSLPGYAKVRFTYNGEPMVYATFTIYGSGWTVTGHGSGRLSSPTSITPSFHGSLSLTSGSGRYRGAYGSGQLYGVFNRRDYALTVQTIGKLRY